jgi:hypothetical protein
MPKKLLTDDVALDKPNFVIPAKICMIGFCCGTEQVKNLR